MTTSELARAANAALIGQEGSRYRLQTPALILDLDQMERNSAAMAGHCARSSIALRPHAKTHKSTAIAARQIASGARGIACATLAEAEAMAAAGIPGLLVTSPVVGRGKRDRLADLVAMAGPILLVADHPDHVADLTTVAGAAHHDLPVLVDVDVGQHRTGTASLEAALALAERIAATEGLTFAGLQAYAGHLQHVADFALRREQCRQQMAKVAALRRALAKRGLAAELISGGGTGSHEIDALDQVLSELQAGSYLFMDVEYEAVALRANPTTRPFGPALFVQTTVVSANLQGFVTTDAGIKSFATDGPLPRIAFGAPEGATYRLHGDEHGAVVFARADQRLAIGSVVECVVPHCDPSVNLYDHYHCVRGDRLVDIWSIDARGR